MKFRNLRLSNSLIVLFLFMFFAVPAQENGSPKIKKDISLELKAGPDNPRNSEGDFITLKDGRLLFIYTKYSGASASDHAPAQLSGRYSADGGNTWSKDQLIVDQEGEMNVMSVSILRLKKGPIALFYLRKNSEKDCIPMMRVSVDEARTWSQPVACIRDKTGYFVLNNDRVVQLRSGRLLMPVALHTSPVGKWQEKGEIFCYYSDDDGKNWTSTRIPDTTTILTQEPGVLELSNGRVLMFMRASGDAQQYSWSSDQGLTWSHIEKSNIRSPVSPASMARIPGTKDIILVWNDNDESNLVSGNQRTPLNMAISKDDGETWIKKKTIEDNPDGWYCYTAIYFNRKNVFLGYIAGSQSRNQHLSSARIARVRRSDIYE